MTKASSSTRPIGDGRLLRVCDLCGAVDPGPRHVIAGSVEGAYPRPSDEIVDKVIDAANALDRDDRNRLVRDLLDTSSSDRHIDCCRAAGCPDGTCERVSAGAENLRDDELLTHLVDNPITRED